MNFLSRLPNIYNRSYKTTFQKAIFEVLNGSHVNNDRGKKLMHNQKVESIKKASVT